MKLMFFSLRGMKSTYKPAVVAGLAAIWSWGALAETAPPPQLGPEGLAGYEAFRAAGPHRAFAIAPGGAWAWVSDLPDPEVAETEAIRACSGYTDQRCTIYAVDDQVVLNRDAWAASFGPYLSVDAAAARPVGTRRTMRFPDLALVSPDGAPTPLSDFRGDVVFLHFWGSWCAPCQVEFPELQQLFESLENEPRIAFVLVQSREDIARSRSWAARGGITMPLYDSGVTGPSDRTFRLADGSDFEDRLVAPLFPATYVLDGQGLILFSHFGPLRGWPEYEVFLRHAAEHMPR